MMHDFNICAVNSRNSKIPNVDKLRDELHTFEENEDEYLKSFLSSSKKLNVIL